MPEPSSKIRRKARPLVRVIGMLVVLALVALLLSVELRSGEYRRPPSAPGEAEPPDPIPGNGSSAPGTPPLLPGGGAPGTATVSAAPAPRAREAGPRPPLTARERETWAIGRRFWLLLNNRGDQLYHDVIAGSAAPHLTVIVREPVATRAGAFLPVPSICFLGYRGDVHPYLRADRVRTKVSYKDCGRYGILTRETGFALRYVGPLKDDVPAVLLVMADGRRVITDPTFDLLLPIRRLGYEVLPQHPYELQVSLSVRECRSTGLELFFAWEDGVYHEVVPKFLFVAKERLGKKISLEAYAEKQPLIRDSYLLITTAYDPADPPKRLRVRVRGEDGKTFEFDREIE